MRFQSVDAFRVYAIFGVTWAHTLVFGGLSLNSPLAQFLYAAVMIGNRWTMPFFFMLSGYFLGGKLLRQPSDTISIARKYTGRLALVFLFWCIIYAIQQPSHVLNLAKEHPLTLILEGPTVHLWFLMSLILTVWLFVLYPFDKQSSGFLLLGLFLYILGLLGGAYRFTHFGFHLPFSNKDGIFFSTLFFAIGVLFSKNLPRINPIVSLGIALSGFIIFCIEAYTLRFHELPTGHNYLVGTIPFSVGVFLFVFRGSDNVIDRLVGSYGKYVLGIYSCHVLFVTLWRPYIHTVNVEIALFIYPVIVFLSAFLTTAFLQRTPIRYVVT